MPSELAMRIAAACEQEASTAMPYFGKIIDESIAPLLAENERLQAMLVGTLPKFDVDDDFADNAALRQQVAELRDLLKESVAVMRGRGWIELQIKIDAALKESAVVLSPAPSYAELLEG